MRVLRSRRIYVTEKSLYGIAAAQPTHLLYLPLPRSVRFFGPVIRTEREVSPATRESSVFSTGAADDIGNNVSKANANLIGIMARPALSVYF